jgi:hypothetical protein
MVLQVVSLAPYATSVVVHEVLLDGLKNQGRKVFHVDRRTRLMVGNRARKIEFKRVRPRPLKT